MNDRPRHADDWTDSIRTSLDREAADVADRHADRLAAAHQAALRARPQAPSAARARWTTMLPIAASVAVVALAAVLLSSSPDRPAPMPETTDLELLASDEFELLGDDLEFYAWLATQDAGEPEQS
ncbi:hypothetical protein [Halomonas denitrificans]|nr:hypothetical protein [Halomonas denitrificans]